MEDLTVYLSCAVLTAGIGSGFQHGYHTGVMNIPYKMLKDWENSTIYDRDGTVFDETRLNVLWGATTSMLNIGGALGGFLSGFICSKVGPKNGLFFNNFLMIVASLLMTIAKYIKCVEVLIIGRFLIGVNCGINVGLCPMYIAEISTVRLRGGLATVYQLVITISIFLSQVISIDSALGSDHLWPLLFVIPACVGVCQMFALSFLTESPKYLLSVKEDASKAEEALKLIRNKDDVSAELNEMQAADEAIKDLPKVSFKDMFSKKSLRTPLLIAIGLMLAQQFSGINAVMFYSTQTFEIAHLSREHAIVGTLVMSFINVLVTVLAVYLVEALGRKTLLLIGFLGMALTTLLLSFSLHYAKDNNVYVYLSIVLIVLYIVMFAPGVGPIPWFLVSEIFNQSSRPLAVSLAVPTNWIANFIVTLCFPALQVRMESWVFFIFVGFNVIFFIFVLLFVPETKNKSIEEIIKKFE